MDLQCRPDLASRYKSGAQIARILTEDWCARQLYCPACDSNRLNASIANTPVIDFLCPQCDEPFQLKSLRHWNPVKIVDAAYDAMIRSIRADRTPNLLVLQYSAAWQISNLLLVPRMFFTESVVEKRKPLAPNARRAGWVGCNILLSQIPEDGKIALISSGVATPSRTVRDEYARVKKLASLSPALRGWTLDVLNVVRKLDKRNFSLAEVYDFEQELCTLHPRNSNVRPKIRQQLQILRDLNFLEFLSPGRYRIL